MPRWATTSSTTSVPAAAAAGDEPQVGRRRRAPRGPSRRRDTAASASARARVRSPTSSTTSAPAASTCGQHAGSASGRSSTTPGRAGGQGGDHVAGRGLGHVRRGAASGGEHGAPLLGGQHRQQRLGRHPAADVAQVVPAPAGQVLDAGGHLEAAAQQVEVDDDGRRPGRREPAPDGEGEGARAEATGGPDDGGHGWCGTSSGQPRRPPGAGATTASSPDLWTTTLRTGRPLWTAGSRDRGAAPDGRVRTWDGPGRGDNRGRRRAELRGGEAGPPFAQPRRGASEPIVSHDRVPAQALVATLSISLSEWPFNDGIRRFGQPCLIFDHLATAVAPDAPDGSLRPAARPTAPTRRRLRPASGAEASSCRGPRGRPGVLHAVVVLGRAHHDRSISGLPARGYPSGPR